MIDISPQIVALILRVALSSAWFGSSALLLCAGDGFAVLAGGVRDRDRLLGTITAGAGGGGGWLP